MNNVNSVSDLMVAAAEALRDGDVVRLEELQSVSEGWLQSDEERNAQDEMLDAMLEVAHEMNENS